MPYDIIILAGQSNAMGNGDGSYSGKLDLNEVYEIIDKNPSSVYDDKDGNPVLDIIMPVACDFRVAQEREYNETKTLADLSLSFASNYAKNDCLKDGNKLLIVKTAVGGTGFTKKQWGVGAPLYERLCQMVDYALQLEEGSRIVAMLWHQGEHDAWEKPERTYEERYDFYYHNFYEQCLAIRTRYSAWNFPIIAGSFSPSWRYGIEKPDCCLAIYNATKAVLNTLGKGAFVSSEGLTCNAQAIGNGDDLHFSRQGLYDFGDRYFCAYQKIIEGNSVSED